MKSFKSFICSFSGSRSKYIFHVGTVVRGTRLQMFSGAAVLSQSRPNLKITVSVAGERTENGVHTCGGVSPANTLPRTKLTSQLQFDPSIDANLPIRTIDPTCRRPQRRHVMNAIYHPARGPTTILQHVNTLELSLRINSSGAITALHKFSKTIIKRVYLA